MKLKFFYNILLTLGIVLLLLSAVSAYNNGQHMIFGISVALLILLFWLKIQLLKQVKDSVKRK